MSLFVGIGGEGRGIFCRKFVRVWALFLSGVA